MQENILVFFVFSFQLLGQKHSKFIFIIFIFSVLVDFSFSLHSLVSDLQRPPSCSDSGPPINLSSHQTDSINLLCILLNANQSTFYRDKEADGTEARSDNSKRLQKKKKKEDQEVPAHGCRKEISDSQR